VPVVKSSLETRRKALEFSLRQYRTRLSGFEQQHKMVSELFAIRFNAGELGDDATWFEWEFVLDAARETERQLALAGLAEHPAITLLDALDEVAMMVKL
jgi:hypothetical protein